jgi:hypothetical protein
MSAVGLKLLELRVVEALNDVETAETRLNKERAKAGLTPAPKEFFTAAEMAAALAARPAEKPKPEYRFDAHKSSPPGASNAAVFAAIGAAFEAVPEASITKENALGIVSAIKAFYEPASDPFAHLAGVDLGADTPQTRALSSWAKTLAAADEIVRAQAGKSLLPPAPALTVVEATAADIARADAIARGEVTPLPTDLTARAIIEAGRKRRAEPGEKPL